MKQARLAYLLFLLGIAMVLGHSGVAIAQGTTTEYGTDRPGSDRYSFDMARPEPKDCENVCLLDQSCRAWTFVRPGFQGPRALLVEIAGSGASGRVLLRVRRQTVARMSQAIVTRFEGQTCQHNTRRAQAPARVT